MIPRYWTLWGKTRRGSATGDETHALVHHMVDVGAVATTLWRLALPAGVRRRMAAALTSDEDEAGSHLAWLAALHDLGKASPAFQAQHAPAVPLISAAGLPFGRLGSDRAHHTAIGHAELLQMLPALLGHVAPAAVRGVAAVVGGHRGRWYAVPPDIPSWDLGDVAWTHVRRALVKDLTALLRPPVCHWPEERMALNPLLATLAGLVTVADWLGSVSADFA